MSNRIVLTIVFIALFVATCSTLKQTRNVNVKTDSKKVIIKGNNDEVNIHIYQDTVRVDSL